jgi:uncharacterized membrane protein
MKLIVLILLLLLDSIYIGFQLTYFKQLYLSIQNSPLKINFIGVILCYVFLVGVLDYFILSQKKSVKDAFLLGIAVYGVYESTNYATFKKWPIYLLFMDTLWGGILFALTTWIYYKIQKWKINV